jgi:preprotein translocase subunit SecF
MKWYRSISLLVLVFGFQTLLAQESSDAQDLGEQYKELKENSNNYQIYKVVKEASMDRFWSSVEDTLEENRTAITGLRAQVRSLQTEVAELKDAVAVRDTSLAEQEYMIEHMEFLGVGMTKSGYKAFTWGLILVLVIAALVLYFRFKSANRITKQTRKEFENLQEEFEEHRKQTRDRETKLRRDLQTELNRVEEMKAKLGEV